MKQQIVEQLVRSFEPLSPAGKRFMLRTLQASCGFEQFLTFRANVEQLDMDRLLRAQRIFESDGSLAP